MTSLAENIKQMIKKNSQRGVSLVVVMIVLTVMALLTILVISLTKINPNIELAPTRSGNQEVISAPGESSTNAENSLSKPTFSSSYQTSTNTRKGDTEVSDIKIEITPLDLADRKIDGIKLDLSKQGLPTPSEAYAKINAAEEKTVRDWTCQLGPIIICQGPTVLVVKAKSTFDLFFTKSIGNAPANLTVDLLENSNTAATLSIPLQNP